MTAKCYYRAMGTKWQPMASCRAPSDHPAHGCGIYGWHSLEHLNDVLSLDTSNAAIGVIDGWGPTLLGTRGFRSRYARLRAVTYLPDETSVATCRRLGIEVYNDWEKMAEAWPSEDLSGLVQVETPSFNRQKTSTVLIMGAALGAAYRENHAHAKRRLREAEKRLAEMQRRSEDYRGQFDHLRWIVQSAQDEVDHYTRLLQIRKDH